MGIKNLNSLIKPYSHSYPNFEKCLERWKGRKIAIDASNWLYARLSIAKSNAVKRTHQSYIGDIDSDFIIKFLLEGVKQFVSQFLNSGITPIFVFDGAPPEAKSGELKKRKEEKNKVRAEIKSLEAKLSAIHSLDRDLQEVERLKKLKSRVRGIFDEIDILQQVLDAIGIPWLKAMSEAEELCTLLCINKDVAAVYSTDTDNIARRCPVLLTGRDRTTKQYRVYYYDQILDNLKLTKSQFLELCIMAGCFTEPVVFYIH